MKSVGFGIATLSVFLVSGCDPKVDVEPEQVEAELYAALAPGDPSEKIEQYLENQGIAFSYDRFTNRYQAIIRHPESNFHAIAIRVYVDEEKRFISAEARDSYTAP